MISTSRTQQELNLGSCNWDSSHLVPGSVSLPCFLLPSPMFCGSSGLSFRLMVVGTIWRPFQQTSVEQFAFKRTRERVFEVEVNTQMVENEQLREFSKSAEWLGPTLKFLFSSLHITASLPTDIHWCQLNIFFVTVLWQSISCGILKALLFSLLQQRGHGPGITAEPSSLVFGQLESVTKPWRPVYQPSVLCPP